MVSPYIQQVAAGLTTAQADQRYLPSLADKSKVIKAQVALAAQKQGTSSMNIVFMGDSITAGTGNTTYATSPPQGSFPTKLISEMSARCGWNAAHGLQVLVPQNGIATPDIRLNAGASNWTRGGLGWGDGSTFRSAGNLVDQIAVWTPGTEAYDSAWVDMYTGGGLGIITVTATGGAPVTFNTDTGSSGISRVSVSAAALLDSNTITLKMNSSLGPDAGVYSLGITCYDSAQKQILIGNAGRPNSLTADWSGSGVFGTLAVVTNYAPDLSVIMLGTNDMLQSVSVATSRTNLQSLITTCAAVGSVILMTPPPSSDATVIAAAPAYNAMLKALAISNNIPLIDVYSAFGGTFQTTLMGDSVHPNNAGYAFIASLIGATFAGIF